MNILYTSKMALEVVVPIAFFLGATFYVCIANGVWMGIIIDSLLTLLVTYLYCKIKYIITDKHLIVKVGSLTNRWIPIGEIKCITRSDSPIRLPVLFLDRIRIFYGRSKSIIISPQNRAMFVDHLTKINPAIKYLGKN